MEFKQLTDAINQNDIEKVKVLLSFGGSKINDVDENGMTPLQHACFKGNLDLVDYLVVMGADVNSNKHNMGYTALMFAALSGKDEVVIRLLNIGAKVHHVNSVGRTASQMAAFIGNHRVATIINNYIERSDIQHFTKPNGVKQEVRLNPTLVDSVHKLSNQVNFSPVKICMVLREEYLIEHWQSISNVFEILSKNYFDPHDTNEAMSIKLFILAYICRKAGESYENDNKDLNQFIRKLLAGIPPSGLAGGQEKLLRQALKEFPHLESQLYRIIISEVHKVQIGHQPTTVEVLNSRINGNVFFRNPEDPSECATCFSIGNKNKKCASCLAVAYCNVNCQRIHWTTHKKFCKLLKERVVQQSHAMLQNDGDTEVNNELTNDECTEAITEENEEPMII